MIALIAHDRKKADMLDFVRKHPGFFRTQQLTATGRTGQLLADELGLPVERVVHGPEGGDLILVLLDDPDRTRETLLLRFIQKGIDYYGVVQSDDSTAHGPSRLLEPPGLLRLRGSLVG